MADAFEKQLDSLFGDEAMDISADITVFETLLKQEGLWRTKGRGLKQGESPRPVKRVFAGIFSRKEFGYRRCRYMKRRGRSPWMKLN